MAGADMKHVLIECVCECCGNAEVIAAPYNEFHDLYETALPMGWHYLDREEFDLSDGAGDYCEACWQSLRTAFASSFAQWRAMRGRRRAGRMVDMVVAPTTTVLHDERGGCPIA
ncbi:hypothetical protein GTZ99_01575 [Novosphingobium sp. FSY-8]|uniref:Uncharacterized protein n=1 Tax=Novosphingobium ovatum TaxID=1908523 RepID=A0ABW9X9P9_9SPHN|nr:hypothetical protein [Novosphingobium ovatum]NBC35244.1 hypothetical protein [Novosphingobium ovatum]